MKEKFWDEFNKLLNADKFNHPPPGDDWFTVHDFAKQFKIGIPAAQSRIKRMVARGFLIKKLSRPNGINYYTSKRST